LISLPILSASLSGTFIGYKSPNNYEKEAGSDSKFTSRAMLK
jgi:hypothetical protein